jgi:hypothetical protein
MDIQPTMGLGLSANIRLQVIHRLRRLKAARQGSFVLFLFSALHGALHSLTIEMKKFI